MTAICSVVLVTRPFVVLSENEKIFVDKGAIVLAKNQTLNLFLPHLANVIIAGFDDDAVEKYLRINSEDGIKNNWFRSQRECPEYLIIHSPIISFTEDMLNWINNKQNDNRILHETLELTCLAIFSLEISLCSFLFSCLTNISRKVRVIIQSDISACWHLEDVASRLCISGSLLKKN